MIFIIKQVYTDDFIEIDEDDILIDLAKAKETHGQQLFLTIVPDEVDWNRKTAQQYTPAQANGNFYQWFLNLNEIVLF